MRDQQGGRRTFELVLVDVVEGLARFKTSRDRFIDFFHAQAFEIEDALDDDGFLFGLFWGVRGRIEECGVDG